MIEFGEIIKLMAYLAALAYCWRIRADHPHPARMRRAWTWLAASSALSILRHAFELTGCLAAWELDRMSWRQILIVLALLTLTVGLGLHWHRLDWLWLAAIVLLAVPAALALGLHRISVEMTGGKWATALQWMVAFLLARLVCLCFLTAVPGSWLPITLLGWAAPWMFVLAAAERMSEQIFAGANKSS